MPSIPSFTPSTDNLPHGLDLADGLNGRLGTPSPAGAVKFDTPNGENVDSSLIPIEETADSPNMERSEQCTVRKSFTGDYNEMLNRWIVYPRGTLVVDSANNYFRVLNTTLSRLAGLGSVGRLDITCEALSFDNPPDEFYINTVDLGLDLLKNPRYFYSLIPTSQIPGNFWPTYLSADNPLQEAVKSTIIRGIQAYRENPVVPPSNMQSNISGFLHDLVINVLGSSGPMTYPVRNTNFKAKFKASAQEDPPKIYNQDGSDWPAAATADGQPNLPILYVYYDPIIHSDPGGKIALALAAAQELICKLWRQEDSPPVYGLELVWSEYSWRPPYLNLGSYIEDPRYATPALPDYFTCPAIIPDGSTIFDAIGNFNPQYYSPSGFAGGGTSISWLRQADTIEFQRTFFKVTRRWLGAPVGCWDGDLFNQNHRPVYASDYKTLVFS